MKRLAQLLLACIVGGGAESARSLAAPQALSQALDFVLLARVGPPGWCSWRTYGGRSRWLAAAGASRQRYADGCGAAALQALLLASHGARWRQSLLYALTRQPRGGTSLARLQSVAQQLGVACRVETLDAAAAPTLAAPALVHLRRRHFVVLLEISGERAVVVDPACGRLLVAASALRNAASGLALRCTASSAASRPGGGAS